MYSPSPNDRHFVTRRRRTIGALTCVAAGLVTTAPAVAQTSAPAGVFCVPATAPYGPAYGPGVPSYGIATGSSARSGDPARVRLNRAQVLTNQRVSQAAIRRADAIQKWLDAGIVGTDICGGALGPEDFSGITPGTVPAASSLPGPSPRKLNIARGGQGDPSRIRLTRAQFVTNQRVAQAAVRRSNALLARFSSGLSGGDVVDGSLGASNLRLGFSITATLPPSTPPAPTTTVIVGSPSGDPSRVTATKKALLIEQRISQAAVRRTNGLVAHIRTGLNGNDFRNASLTARDLAPGVVR